MAEDPEESFREAFMPLGVVGVLSGRTLDCLTYAENKYRQRFCELSELTGGDTFRRDSYPAIFPAYGGHKGI